MSSSSSLDNWVPKIGETIADRYRVSEVLGNGAMGVIVRAEDGRLGRDVALKFLHPKIRLNEGYADRFKREAKLGMRLNHARIVRCRDYGETESGLLFLALELVEGRTLRSLMDADGGMSARRIRSLSEQILDALAAAHVENVVHRDLKPTNIMVAIDHRNEEKIKILDFGLARTLASDETKITKTGKIVGTAAYIAPESLVTQNTGKPGDVYAIGVMMLEMFFGRKFFDAPTVPQTFLQHLTLAPPLPKRLWDSEFGQIIAKALEKYPPNRFADCEEMYQALRGAAPTADFSLQARELPPPAPTDLPKTPLKRIMAGDHSLELLAELPRPECYTAPPSALDSLDDVFTESPTGDGPGGFESAPTRSVAGSSSGTPGTGTRTAPIPKIVADQRSPTQPNQPIDSNTDPLYGGDDVPTYIEGNDETSTLQDPMTVSGSTSALAPSGVSGLPALGLGFAHQSDETTRESFIFTPQPPIVDTQEHVDTVPKKRLTQEQIDERMAEIDRQDTANREALKIPGRAASTASVAARGPNEKSSKGPVVLGVVIIAVVAAVLVALYLFNQQAKDVIDIAPGAAEKAEAGVRKVVTD